MSVGSGEDILRTGEDDRISAHFVGSVCTLRRASQVTHQAPLLVIDGQQRLTTVMLLIESLARHLGDSEPLDGFQQRNCATNLLNPLEEGERAFGSCSHRQTRTVSLQLRGRRRFLENHLFA